MEIRYPSTLLSAVTIAVLACGTAFSQQTTVNVTPGSSIDVPKVMTIALRAGSQPVEDKDRDIGRRPDKVMAFLGLKRGDTVAEFMASRGYYVGVLSDMVGPNGIVYGHNNGWLAGRIPEGTPLGPRIRASELTNVTEIVSELEDPQIPDDTLDAAYMILFYHDTFWLGTDWAAMNKAIFKCVKTRWNFWDRRSPCGTGNGRQ